MKWIERIWPGTLVFILIHMSSGASVISLSDAALAFFSILTLALAYVKKVNIDKHFYAFSFVYVSLAFFYMMQFGWLNFTATARIYLKILYAYFTIKLVGWRFLNICEDILGKLAAISLPLFAIQLVAPDFMMWFNGLSEVIIPQVPKGPGVDYANSIVFTVNPWGLERNSGFMWEPGAFAGMCSVGIFLNLIIYKFKVNWKLVCLTLGCITAFSTTGYLLIMLVGAFWLMNQKLKTVMISVPVMTLLAIWVFTLPDVRDKVIERYENRNKTIDNQDSYADDREGISVGRFGSFILDWNDMKNYPIIGYGLQQSERTTGRYVDLVRANGFSDFMVKFGLLGLAFLFWSLTQSFYRFGKIYGAKGLWMGTVLIVALSFSNPVLVKPFFFALMFYCIGIYYKQIKVHVESSYSHTYVQS